MEKTFNSEEYFNDLALEIIQNFSKANKATTPVLVGTAKENEIRKKLELVFPSSIGIGTGCVIDTYGHTSKQTDIILYEKDICPIFSINNTPETTYYPCESVIAVGEVKSKLNTKELKDCFSKIESVKKTTRAKSGINNFRTYGSRELKYGEPLNPISKSSDSIFSFILCEKFGLKSQTLVNRYIDLVDSKEKHLVPDLTVSLNDGILAYSIQEINEENQEQNNLLLNSIRGSTGIYQGNCDFGNFQYLLTRLDNVIKSGRTSFDSPFKNYITKVNTLNGGIYYKF